MKACRLPALALVLALVACDGGVYDVREFGASPGDGVDDTESIQSAIDTAAFFGGGVVAFPSGTYDLHGTLEVGRFFVRLQGTTIGGTVLLSHSASEPLLRASPGFFGLGAQQIALEDMTLDGGPSRNGGCLMDLQLIVSSRIQKLRLLRAHDGVCVRNFAKLELSQLELESASHTGSGIVVGCPLVADVPPGAENCGADVTIRDAHITGFGVGLRILNADAVFTANLSIGQSAQSALLIEPSGRSANSTFGHSVFDATKYGPTVHIRGAGLVETTTFSGNWIASAGRAAGGSGTHPGVRIEGPGPRGSITFTGGRIWLHTGRGVDVAVPAIDLLVSGVQFSGITQECVRVATALNQPSITLSGSSFACGGGVDVRLEPGSNLAWVTGSRGFGAMICAHPGVSAGNRFLGGQDGCQ